MASGKLISQKFSGTITGGHRERFNCCHKLAISTGNTSAIVPDHGLPDSTAGPNIVFYVHEACIVNILGYLSKNKILRFML